MTTENPGLSQSVSSGTGPHVLGTLDLLNNTLTPGNFVPTYGIQPFNAAYDNRTGEIFVSNLQSDTLSVISDSTDTVVAGIQLNGQPEGMAYDSARGEVFVSTSGSVDVISDKNNTVVASIPENSSPAGVVYDSAKGEVFVANAGAGIEVVSDASNTVVANISMGGYPMGMAYDRGKGEVFVSKDFSSAVGVISDATNTVVATIPVGAGPIGVAYDSARGEVLVANWNSANVSVISDATNTVLTSFSPGSFPDDVVYDSGRGDLFVTSDARAWVLSDSTGSVSATILLGAATGGGGPLHQSVYDPGTGQVFVPNAASDNVSVISDTTNSVVAWIDVDEAPTGPAQDSSKGELFVANPDSNSVWVISEATTKVVAKIFVANGPSFLVYDSGAGEIFAASQSSHDVAVISDGTNSVVANVLVGGYPAGMAYDSGRGEVFVTDSIDSVDVISDATNAVVAQVQVGQGPVAAAYDPGKGEVFVTNADSNTVSVIWDATDAVVATVPVGLEPTGVVYDGNTSEVFVVNSEAFVNSSTDAFNHSVSVIWDATDSVVATVPLPSSNPVATTADALTYDDADRELFVANFDSNNVDVISEVNDSWIATVRVGVYPTGAAYAPSSGSVYVSNRGGTLSIISHGTASSNLAITAFDARPPVVPIGSLTQLSAVVQDGVGSLSYSYSRLPAGCVSLNASSLQCVSTATGTYLVLVTVTDSLDATATAVTPISVTSPWHVLAFSEVGLTAGTPWSVLLVGASVTTNTSSISFEESNGSYAFSIVVVPGYTVSPSSGLISVEGGNQNVTVTFARLAPVGGILGLSPSGVYVTLGGILAVAIVGIVAVALVRRRGRAPSEDPGEPPSQ